MISRKFSSQFPAADLVGTEPMWGIQVGEGFRPCATCGCPTRWVEKAHDDMRFCSEACLDSRLEIESYLWNCDDANE